MFPLPSKKFPSVCFSRFSLLVEWLGSSGRRMWSSDTSKTAAGVECINGNLFTNVGVKNVTLDIKCMKFWKL